MDKDLIVVILAAVFGIISAVISSKKKAAERQQQQPSPFDSDPYETTEHPAHADFRGVEATVDYSEADPGPWSYDSLIVDETSRQMPMDLKAEHAMNKLGRDIKSNKHKQNTEGAEAEDSCESEKTNIIMNFNLRDAVIYSELLKPKFED